MIKRSFLCRGKLLHPPTVCHGDGGNPPQLAGSGCAASVGEPQLPSCGQPSA
eukprot:SAG25_NODE_6652_length_541_cov_0.601810_2_plen_51_part_01